MSTRLPYFKSYDIRGTVPDPLDAEAAYRIGRATAAWTGAGEIVVGRDGRLSSPSLAEALMTGLLDGGVTVLDTGMVTTPMLNYAVAQSKRYGLMVTASHNPKEYNGIKLIDPGVEQVYYGRGLEAVEELVVKNRFGWRKSGGRLRVRPVLQDYEDDLAKRFSDAKFPDFPVVLDCSNGVGGLPLRVLERLGIEHTLLYQVPDGDFPNHGCDTLRLENLRRLQEEVKRQKAGLGIMFDGDSDRVAFVDGRGEIAPLDLVFVLLARRELARRTGRIFHDLRFSRVVPEEVERLGGTPVRMRVGNPFHKEALHRHADALLAAELSGHIMYQEHFGIDDPLFASLKLLACLAGSGDSLSQQLRPLRRYAGSGEIRIEAPDPRALSEKARTRFGDGRLSEIDGITVEYPDWWFNLRPSNTEPVAKLVIEADSPALLERRLAVLLDFLAGAGGTVELPDTAAGGRKPRRRI